MKQLFAAMIAILFLFIYSNVVHWANVKFAKL